MRIFWERRPKSTGSKIKSQALRMPNPGKVKDLPLQSVMAIIPETYSCHMVFPLPGVLFASLPHTLTSQAALFLGDAACLSPVPWNLCLLPLARFLTPPSTTPGFFAHTHAHIPSAALINSHFHHLFTICLLTCELPQPSTALKNDLLTDWLTK